MQCFAASEYRAFLAGKQKLKFLFKWITCHRFKLYTNPLYIKKAISTYKQIVQWVLLCSSCSRAEPQKIYMSLWGHLWMHQLVILLQKVGIDKQNEGKPNAYLVKTLKKIHQTSSYAYFKLSFFEHFHYDFQIVFVAVEPRSNIKNSYQLDISKLRNLSKCFTILRTCYYLHTNGICWDNQVEI